MKIYISHSSAYDYEKVIYEPIRRSNLFSAHEFFLPHEQDNTLKNTKQIIVKSDAIVAETSLPSTGQGIELGWADMSGVPILCMGRRGAATSSSLKYVCTDTQTYETTQELIAAIDLFIKNL